jgi:hypothetical protein
VEVQDNNERNEGFGVVKMMLIRWSMLNKKKYNCKCNTIDGNSRTTLFTMATNRASSLVSMHPNVDFHVSPIAGHGLVCRSLIQAGEVVWDGNLSHPDTFTTLTADEVRALPYAERKVYLHFAFEIAEGLYEGCLSEEIAELDAANFMNHSCDANTWFKPGDGKILIARRDIHVGEEITYDYATSDSFEWPEGFGSRDDTFTNCQCEAKCCRHQVKSTDWKLPAVREQYHDHFIPYLNEKIRMFEAAGVSQQ